MKCYYHNDNDGRCAGAIVYSVYSECEMIESDYKNPIDIEAISFDEDIYIVDFSFTPEVMEEVLKKTKNIIWIDHHETAMEYKYSEELKGARDNSHSGCVLTWKWFNSGLPEGVKLIGDYDTWAFKYGEQSRLFYLGLQLYDTNPRNLSLWAILFEDNKKLVEQIIEEGRTCRRYRDNFCKDCRTSYGFETIFEGYKCYALNLYKLGSPSFGEKFHEYDICLSFVFDGLKWTVGLYSDKVDVGKLA